MHKINRKLFSMVVPALKIFRKKYHVTVLLLSLIFLVYTSSSQDKGLPLRLMAYEYLQKNQMDEAEAAFQRAIKTTPDDILNYRDLAIFYLVQKKYAKSEATANAGLRLKPGNEELKSVLAKVYIQTGEKMPAYNELYSILQKNNKNVFAIYNIAMLNPFGIEASKKAYLLNALSLSPTNVVIHLSLIEALIKSKETDSALYYMQNIKRIVPEFPPAVALSYNKAVSALQGNKPEQVENYLNRFKDVFKVTASYIEGLSVLEGPKLSLGYADFTSSHIQNKNTGTTTFNIRFSDATNAIGIKLPEGKKSSGEIVAIADYSDAGEMFIYYSYVTEGKQTCYLLASTIGGFQPSKVEGGIEHLNQDLDAAFIDYDNDGYQDLFVATTKGILLYKKNTSGIFVFHNKNIGLNNAVHIQKMLFADFDQDGDLDMYAITTGINKFFRNNADGTFTEQAGKMGLSDKGGTSNGDFLDYDADGDLDIVTIGLHAPVRLFSNSRRSGFKNVTASAMMKSGFSGLSVASADYNNDGLTDLFISGISGHRFLLKNINGTKFDLDPVASTLITETLGNANIQDASFFDFDNDGYMDLLVAGANSNASSQSVFLFHNDASKGFSNVSHLLPRGLQANQIAIADFNFDGDDDIFLVGPQGIKLLRNDGGNLHQYMQMQLTGISYGSNKNNRLGIGAQVEVRAGNLYQMKTIKKSITNFGLGTRTSVDAVRIIWPNGTPQLIKDPSANERIMEEQMLKGSCPFLFVWNGERYEFFKDMMWRSALGMPLAVKGTDTLYAFSNPSKEYLLISGEKFKPKDNKYSIKITEELWETVYFDKATLTAVDHPDSIDVFADERFTPPPFAGKKVYGVGEKRYPLSAVDGKGNDLLTKITAYDFQYISNFGMGKFQGLAEDHDLILDLGDKAVSDSLYLFLRGWIFPADASINTSMTQSTAYSSKAPCLQVMNKKGEWQTVIDNIGFPMGKDKMVIANLTGKFLTAHNRKIRIRTNMQIYWDEIFYSNQLSEAPVKMHDLSMSGANLSFRGYSASYRKGGPFGPHWFDYYNTSGGQKWRDLTGYYTRYGDVKSLLQQADDEYIITNSGDVISIEFDAGNLPQLPKGWKRDFLIYSEGWVKDGDLNTAYGQTVEPLPFHAMPAYPYRANVKYPSDARHTKYRQQYNTRLINTDNFKNALKPLAGK